MNYSGDTWPLLSDDGDISSEIGRVEMCGDEGSEEACEDQYLCKIAKAGAYCVERAR